MSLALLVLSIPITDAKVDATFDILSRHDFVYLHVEAPDECGHMGDSKLKQRQ